MLTNRLGPKHGVWNQIEYGRPSKPILDSFPAAGHSCGRDNTDNRPKSDSGHCFIHWGPTVKFDIESIGTTIVDLPIRRTHGIGAFTMNRQSTVIVQVRTSDGVIGLGEGIVPGGGPQWGGESVETIQQVIDGYLAPALTGKVFTGVNDVAAALARVTVYNNFSVAAVEMALWDLTGKHLGCSVGELLGGLRRETIDVLWSIGSTVSDPLEEALKYVDAGHKYIKFMLGTGAPKADCARVTEVVPHLPADTTTIVDFNGRWNEATARKWLPVLADAGVGIAEQPLPRGTSAVRIGSRSSPSCRSWPMRESDPSTTPSRWPPPVQPT